MAVLTVRMPDDRHSRLKALAASQGVSVNKMIEELTTHIPHFIFYDTKSIAKID